MSLAWPGPRDERSTEPAASRGRFFLPAARVAGRDEPVSFPGRARTLELADDRLASLRMRRDGNVRRRPRSGRRRDAFGRTKCSSSSSRASSACRHGAREVRRRGDRVRALSRKSACATRNSGVAEDFFSAAFATPERRSPRPPHGGPIHCATAHANARGFANHLKIDVCEFRERGYAIPASASTSFDAPSRTLPSATRRRHR